MMRIIVDSQSNSLFRGSALEQSYSQRGGLCEVGDEHIVVCREEVDPDYLAYWRSIGFTLPKLVMVHPDGPDDTGTLSELLAEDEGAQAEILRHVGGCAARIEFFTIAETEQRLLEKLPIPGYCNSTFSIQFESKPAFRRLACHLGLPQIDGAICRSFEDLRRFALPRLQRGQRVIVKSERGTGGLACGGMQVLADLRDLENVPESVKFLGQEFLAEEVVEGVHTEASLQWEITESGEISSTAMAQQLAPQFGYIGTCWPPDLPAEKSAVFEARVRDQLGPAIRALGARGFFCCDLIVDPREHWMDFNPRKGAIRYILQMVQRHRGKLVPFWHEHFSLGRPAEFGDVRRSLDDLLDPSRRSHLVVTNPSLLQHGFVDLTGIGPTRDEARNVLNEGRKQLLAA